MNILRKILAVIFALVVLGATFFLIQDRQIASKPGLASNTPHPARYYETLSDKRVRCRLCPKHCTISPGQFGGCKARQNIAGKLFSIVYGKIASSHVDPIEKKPFFHVLPGEKAFSIATTGCNMRCLFCQNWQISQAFPTEAPTRAATPEDVVREAVASGAKSIAFTYTEPVIFYEYLIDIAKLAKKAGLKTLVVSNGYIEEEPLKEMLRYVDAYKVDFKAFNEDFYVKMTSGHLDPVLRSMKLIKQSGVWLEIVTLLVTGQNDSDEEIRALSRWIKDNLGDDVPLHFSRFFPQYKLQNVPPTPEETILRARRIAMEEGLKFVYTGNITDETGEATYCPQSKEKVIIRQGMFTTQNNLKNGTCTDGEKIPGVWQ